LLLHSAGIDLLEQLANLPDIIHELAVFQETVSSGSYVIRADIREVILERVTTIEKALCELQMMPEKFSEVYIG